MNNLIRLITGLPGAVVVTSFIFLVLAAVISNQEKDKIERPTEQFVRNVASASLSLL